MELRVWEASEQTDAVVQKMHEDVQQWCAALHPKLTAEMLFAIFIFRLLDEIKDRLTACTDKNNVKLPSTNLCGIRIAVPVITRRKEKVLRAALSELCKKRGIDNRCVSLITEPKAAAYAVIRAIEEGKNGENNRGCDVKFCESDRLFVVDAGGFTTVSDRNCRNLRERLAFVLSRSAADGDDRTYVRRPVK